MTVTMITVLTVMLFCCAPAQGHQSEEDLTEHHITWGRPNTNIAFFDDDTPSNVTAVVGQRATLPCQVVNLDKKDVSWIRQRDLHILTVGIFTYTSDDRFKVYHPENSDQWYLEINPVTFRDAGVYECQVSTSPKIFLPVLLVVEGSGPHSGDSNVHHRVWLNFATTLMVVKLKPSHGLHSR
ncbi:uncharacterized protein [Panulirus ornatus]|uniref:uncharacterized protein n=1 Tax=Panulirus ornatus TaxID=150431 RepID=UPI003A87E8B6